MVFRPVYSDADLVQLLEDVNSVYNKTFAEFFTLNSDLYKRLHSESRPITDDELQSILMDLPLEMMSASEELSSLKLTREVLKIQIDAVYQSTYSKSSEKTDALRRCEGTASVVDLKYQLAAYDSIISRVESKISFSRELIMSAKKIWDARRQTESTMPVATKDYSEESTPKYYVK